MAAHPDLRVLCRKLTSTAPDDLLSVCPSLVNHVLRCGSSLSAAAAEQRQQNKQPKDTAAVAAAAAANETPLLVHKLKTHINTLLNGRTPASRFAGLVLAKSVIDVGGWECLRTSEPWVRGLLSILQKPDPISSKELCVVALTKIYSLLQEYPTLVREIATPTVPTFVTACLQLLKPPAPSKPARVTTDFVETALSALSVLFPLYPTTIRPFTGQIRAIVRPYLAPTSSDPASVPHSLRRCSRRLAVLLHHTAPKSTHAEEWSKHLDSLIRDGHSTADQVFRAVQESWEPSSTFARGNVSSDGEPHGGGALLEELPAWSGLSAGAQRLVGLLESISECLDTPTRCSVALPIAALTDLASRILLVMPPPPGVQERDLREMLLNPSIGREEKDELWSALHEIHVAVVRLLTALVLRLDSNALPLASDLLDQAVRALTSGGSVDSNNPPLAPALTRETTFVLIRELLVICGPTLPKISVDSLGPVIHTCSRDLLAASGFLPEERTLSDPSQGASKNGTRPNGGTGGALANADLFLPPTATSKDSSPGSAAARRAARIPLEPSHMAAAEALLEALLSLVPQAHLKKADRALLDRTAILSRNKAAMVASVLHPYMDRSGRLFANTMPFLVRQFPHDADVEILRTNLRTKPQYYGNVFASSSRGTATDDKDEDDKDEEDGAPVGEDANVSVVTALRSERRGDSAQQAAGFPSHGDAAAGGFARHFESSRMEEVDKEKLDAPSSGHATAPFVPLTLKRKIEENTEESVVVVPSKRQDKGKSPELEDDAGERTIEVAVDDAGDGDGDGGSGSDSDESVHLQMVLDDDEDEEEDDDSEQ